MQLQEWDFTARKTDFDTQHIHALEMPAREKLTGAFRRNAETLFSGTEDARQPNDKHWVEPADLIKADARTANLLGYCHVIKEATLVSGTCTEEQQALADIADDVREKISECLTLREAEAWEKNIKDKGEAATGNPRLIDRKAHFKRFLSDPKMIEAMHSACEADLRDLKEAADAVKAQCEDSSTVPQTRPFGVHRELVHDHLLPRVYQLIECLELDVQAMRKHYEEASLAFQRTEATQAAAADPNSNVELLSDFMKRRKDSGRTD